MSIQIDGFFESEIRGELETWEQLQRDGAAGCAGPDWLDKLNSCQRIITIALNLVVSGQEGES